MKKASILSFQFADNYGALLQIYALQSILEKNNLEVNVLNFRPYELEQPYSVGINFKKSFHLDGAISTMKRIIAKTLTFNRNYKRRKSFNQFRQNYLNLTEESIYSYQDLNKKLPKFDYYFVGSDQVWNPDFFKFSEKAYFLDFAPVSSKKIAYACSIANSVEDDKYKKVFKEELPKFDSISVRESSAKDLLSSLTSENIEVTLDPTLLLNQEEWGEVITSKIETEPYILVYDLQKSEAIINVANKLAIEKNLRIISYSESKEFVNHEYSFSSDGPEKFLSLFKNATFVITSSFHGTVFSVIFEKEFLTVPHSSRGSRMIDLLNLIGLESRIVYDENFQVDNINKIEFAEVSGKLDILRNDSIKYIVEAIK
ncbi:polysaccharide pyruvyl transferase [Aerococcus sp. 150760007-1]|uniref:Polysaccharide pyruvyl transferase family protein n=1 Tax=Aerococcus urinaeequi TaxID=51665 RepID=A0ABR5ZYZ4_9LACT|nr:polysaccharide pyruvyl transferase family protein [Aerococcus urinaeequi]MBA5746959.1 polysaccharide pyruvyl transferase family protein [Aerococcus urinaeequi]MBA5829743.1 polysaccharide pyruvyl transferase family protein [Aerococcus urinaeequi]MBA5860783.1 polysaccharide pyruvyl transferase family protein [Aerococcus urinaeequi]